MGSVKASAGPVSSATSSGARYQRLQETPSRLVRRRMVAAPAGERVADDAGHGEAHAGVERDRRGRGPAGGAADAHAVAGKVHLPQVDRRSAQPGGRRAARPGGEPDGGQQCGQRDEARRERACETRMPCCEARGHATPISAGRGSAPADAGDGTARGVRQECLLASTASAAPLARLSRKWGRAGSCACPARQSVPSSPPKGSPTSGSSGRSSR